MANAIAKTKRYLRRNGLKKTVFAVAERITAKTPDSFRFVPPTKEELERFREELPKAETKISVIVPAYKTNPVFFRELLDSMLAQVYPFWELVIADAQGDGSLEKIVDEYRAKLEKGSEIIYLRLSENLGISANTNAALELATGSYIGLLDHDDVLTPDALYCMAKEIERSAPIMLYSDEDKTDTELKTFYEPHRKKKLKLDLIMTNNYICHFCVMRADVMKELKFRSEYDGAQDYDIILRCILKAKGRDDITHIPRILYHWRCHEESTAANTDSKMYAYESGLKAVEDFAKNKGYDVTVSHTEHLGFYRVEYKPDLFANRPEIGIIAGPVIQGGKVTGGAMNKSGALLYGGMPSFYSGYMHRAKLMQRVSAGDVRNMLVCPGLENLWREEVLSLLDKKNPDYISISLAFCEKARMLGYGVVYDPLLKADKN